VSAASDDELMSQVRDGDAAPLAVLFARYHVALYNFFLRLTGQASTSEDLVQETFLRILKAKHTYRGQGQFKAWMYQVARSARADHWRKRWRETDLPEASQETMASHAPDASDELELSQRQALVRAALARLPEEKREVLVLSRYQDMRYEQIASILGCTEGTVKVRVHRAMKELRAHYLQLTRDKVS
jgi:RNA polymerase sigma-70 factor (ECF subfamily)